MESVEPLVTGTVLFERFVVSEVLGRGGFSVVYAAWDRIQGDNVVVKELAPTGSLRTHDKLDLGPDGRFLIRKFLEEASLQRRLNIPGLVRVRLSFEENGTAYFVSERIFGAITLQSLLRKEGSLNDDGALDIFLALLETVEQIHAKGVLHRDIKPSNILVLKTGDVRLIDFGSAREWSHESIQTQTVVVTSGFAAPEQFSEKGPRGPATDVYGLCATLYNMLMARPPPDSMARVSGKPLILGGAGPLWAAVEKGLSLNFNERPQGIEDLRALLMEPHPETGTDPVSQLDEKIYRSERFIFRRGACPSCGSPLRETKPRGWISLGKPSSGSGTVCENCGTEFAKEGSLLRLTYSANRMLNSRASFTYNLEDWQRIGSGLCPHSELFEERNVLSEALKSAYTLGQIGFEGNPDQLWHGPAIRNSAQEGTLSISETEIAFGPVLRKWRVPLSEIARCASSGIFLRLHLIGQGAPEQFEIQPVELSAQLRSGVVTTILGSSELVARLQALIDAS